MTWKPKKLSELIDSYHDAWEGRYWEVTGPKGSSGRCSDLKVAHEIAREWYPELEDDLNKED